MRRRFNIARLTRRMFQRPAPEGRSTSMAFRTRIMNVAGRGEPSAVGEQRSMDGCLLAFARDGETPVGERWVAGPGIPGWSAVVALLNRTAHRPGRLCSFVAVRRG